MAFLEALANPVSTKDVNSEGSAKDSSALKPEKVTTTPLVQYLKDKKASKKEAVVKASKKQESATKSKSGKESSSSPEESRKKGKDVKGDRDVERAAKEAVKILNREASNKVAAAAANTAKSGIATTTQQTPPKLDLAKVSGRQRGPAIAAHIKMLQRDLGLTPAQAHRQVRRDTADAQKAEKEAAAEKTETPKPVASPAPAQAAVPTAPKSTLLPQNAARGPRNRGQPTRTETPKQTTPSFPMVLLKKNEASSSSTTTTTASVKPSPVPAPRRGPAAAVPSDGATQAFVKHANPSQGVTEILLKEALENFGAVSFVEIDKRKGFAYVDFADTEGLKKAMAANPIPVAQGTVHVAQRKGAAPVPQQQTPVQPVVQEKKPAPQQIPTAPANRGGRGGHGRGGTVGRRGGRGGGGGRGGNSAGSPAPSVPTGPSAK